MSELPNGWALAALGELCKQPDQRSPHADETFTYIDIASVDRDLKIVSETQSLIGANASSRARKRVECGDVIISMTRPNLNAVALIGEQYDGCIASTGFDVLRPIEVEPRWIFSAVKSANFVDAMCQKVQGALYPAVKSADIREYQIPLPPLAEQARIAAKLDELLTQVDTLKARIDGIPALLNRFRQSVLAAAVSGRLTEEWRSKNFGPRETGIQLMVETADRKRDWSESNKSHNEVARVKKRLSEFAKKKLEQTDLPTSWCWAELEDVSLLIVDCHNKTAPYEKEGIPLIRTSNIRDGNFQWKDLRYINEETYKFWSRRCVPEPGDIVFTREAPMGEAAIIPEGKIICLGQRTMLIRCIEKCTSAEFVLLALRDPKFKARSEKLAVGTGVKHYRVGDVSDLLIPVPTKAEQTEIVRRVEQLFIFADQLEARVKAAQTRIDRLTQSILAKAFRGELVPQDPNDEPASVLVDRIKAQRAATPKAMRSRRAATLG